MELTQEQYPIENDNQSLSTLVIESSSTDDSSLNTQISNIKIKNQKLELRRKKQISLRVDINSSLKIKYSGSDKSYSGSNIFNKNKSITKIEKLDQEMPQIFHDNYTIIDYISSGCQAEVYKIQDKITSQYYVAKISKINDLEEEIIMKQEFQILSNLHNKYFVQPIQIIKEDNFNNIILIEEFFEGDNLYDIIKNNQIELTNEQINLISKQLLQAVDYLHKNSFVHRDVNVKNILFNAEQNQIKLIDFGVSRQLKNSQDFMCSPHGNPLFKSPEMTQDWTMYSEKVDEFGVGLVILSLLQKKIIKSKNVTKSIEHQQQLMQQSVQVDQQSNKNELDIFFLAKKLLRKNQHKRISAEQALKLM